MARTMIYRFARGETILVPIKDSEAEEGNEDTVASALKRLRSGRNDVAAGTEAEDVEITPTFRAATADVEKGWNLRISAADSTGLALGRYQIDIAITEAGNVTVSDPAIIEIYEPSSV